MKKITLTFSGLVLLVLSLVVSTTAQEASSRGKWTNDQAVDFVTCSFVKVSIGSGIDCLKLPSLTDLKEEISSKSATRTLPLAKALSGLRTGQKIKDQEPGAVFEYLSKTLFAEANGLNPVKEFLTSPNRKDGQVDQLSNDIEKALRDNFLPAETATAGTTPQPPSDPGNKSQENNGAASPTPPDEEESAGWLSGIDSMYLVFLIVGFVAAGIGFFAYRSSKKKRGGKRSKSDRSGGDDEGKQSMPTRQGSQSQSAGVKLNIRSDTKVRDLEAKIVELEKIIATQKKQIDTLKASIPTPEVSTGYSAPPADFQQAPTPAPSVSRSIFFPAPTPDGLFVSRYSSPTKLEGESLYILKLSSESEAEVHFDNSRISINKAKNSPEQILDPVCEGIRDPMNQILGIRMTAPGKARLEGDDWRVYEKVKLTYEY